MQDIDVLCIPRSSGTKMYKVKLPLLEAATVEYSDESWLLEGRLQYLPNVFRHGDWLGHGGKDRSLINLGNLHPDEAARVNGDKLGPYFMYKCIMKSTGCLPNEHFKGALDAADALGSRDVYGSVFIFKVKKIYEDGRVRYDRVDMDTIWNAFSERDFSPEDILECHNGLTIGKLIPPDPSKIDFDHLEVAWIPHNGSEHVPMTLIPIPLIESDTSTKELEAQLQRVPKIQDTPGLTFSWAHRTLIKVPSIYLGPFAPEWDDDYMIYVCLDEKAGLPVNKYLNQLNGLSNARVYGDAFIFKQQSPPTVRANKRSRYLDGLVISVNLYHGDPCCVAEEILRKFWIAINKEQFETGGGGDDEAD
ncbi:MAG: hypothetical protein Q9161_003806 [Pseudevernia consocians]